MDPINKVEGNLMANATFTWPEGTVETGVRPAKVVHSGVLPVGKKSVVRIILW